MSDTQVAEDVRIPRVFSDVEPARLGREVVTALVQPRPLPLKVRIVDRIAALEHEAPANELSVRRWLSDDLQWVQDERGSSSALAVSECAVHVGDPEHERAVQLTVAGTVRSTGLEVFATDDVRGRPVRFQGLPHAGRASDRARLRTVVIDPDTGQLYWQER